MSEVKKLITKLYKIAEDADNFAYSEIAKLLKKAFKKDIKELNKRIDEKILYLYLSRYESTIDEDSNDTNKMLGLEKAKQLIKEVLGTQIKKPKGEL